MCSQQFARKGLLAVTAAMALALTGCPPTTWTKVFGGTGDEQCYSVVAASDGGYLLAGATWPFGGYKGDMYAVKIDASGKSEWSKTFGGTEQERAFCAVATSDGGYLLAGYTMSFGATDGDMYAVKIDASGTSEWSETYGGAEQDWANCVIATSDGGYLLAGWTTGPLTGNMFVVYANASGVQQWSSTVGSPTLSQAHGAIQTSDGGYLIVGEAYSPDAGSNDMYAVRIDDSGAPQWSKTYGGTALDMAYGVVATSDGGFLLAGMTNTPTPPSYSDVYLVKTDGSGEMQWSKTFGGSGDYVARSLIATSDGGYLMAGYHIPLGSVIWDVYVLKTDASGNALWSNRFGGYEDDVAWSAVEADDGGYVLAGSSNSYYANPFVDSYDAYVIKIDATGHGSSAPTP